MLRKQVCGSFLRSTLTAFQLKQCNALYSNVQKRRSSQRGRHRFPDILPDKPTVILFPGQGSQYVGMAKAYADIPEAKELFDMASEILW